MSTGSLQNIFQTCPVKLKENPEEALLPEL